MSFKDYIKEMEYSFKEYEAGERALKHLKQALVELKIADQNKAGNFDDWKHFISMVQEVISTDNNEAGLEPFLSKLLPSDEPEKIKKHTHWLAEPKAD